MQHHDLHTFAVCVSSVTVHVTAHLRLTFAWILQEPTQALTHIIHCLHRRGGCEDLHDAAQPFAQAAAPVRGPTCGAEALFAHSFAFAGFTAPAERVASFFFRLSPSILFPLQCSCCGPQNSLCTHAMDCCSCCMAQSSSRMSCMLNMELQVQPDRLFPMLSRCSPAWCSCQSKQMKSSVTLLCGLLCSLCRWGRRRALCLTRGRPLHFCR